MRLHIVRARLLTQIPFPKGSTRTVVSTPYRPMCFPPAPCACACLFTHAVPIPGPASPHSYLSLGPGPLPVSSPLPSSPFLSSCLAICRILESAKVSEPKQRYLRKYFENRPGHPPG